MAQRRRTSPRVTPAGARQASRSTRRPPAGSARPRSSSTASSGETGFTGRPVPSSRPAISRRRGWISQCQWYVASTCSRSGAVCRTRLYGGPSRLAARRARTWRSASAVAAMSGRRHAAEIRLVAARHDPDLERRARGVRGEGHAAGVLPDEPSGRRTSSRTSRQNGHSPSRITNRAAPPSSSAIRCGIWGRSYRSRHRWFVRAPAWAPQFWTTWQVLGLAGRPGRRQRVPGPADQALDDLVADGVEGAMLAAAARRSSASSRSRAPGRAPPGRGPRSSSRASSSVPTTWNAKSLSIRTRMPSPSGVVQLAQPKRWSSTGSAARAKRSRWNARSTTVATHQPVIGSLRSSNSPAATLAPQARSQTSGASMPVGERAGERTARRARPRPWSAAAPARRARRRSTSRRRPASRTGRSGRNRRGRP